MSRPKTQFSRQSDVLERFVRAFTPTGEPAPDIPERIASGPLKTDALSNVRLRDTIFPGDMLEGARALTYSDDRLLAVSLPKLRTIFVGRFSYHIPESTRLYNEVIERHLPAGWMYLWVDQCSAAFYVDSPFLGNDMDRTIRVDQHLRGPAYLAFAAEAYVVSRSGYGTVEHYDYSASTTSMRDVVSFLKRAGIKKTDYVEAVNCYFRALVRGGSSRLSLSANFCDRAAARRTLSDSPTLDHGANFMGIRIRIDTLRDIRNIMRAVHESIERSCSIDPYMFAAGLSIKATNFLGDSLALQTSRLRVSADVDSDEPSGFALQLVGLYGATSYAAIDCFLRVIDGEPARLYTGMENAHGYE